VFSEVPSRYDFFGDGPFRAVCRVVDPTSPEAASIFASADLGVLVDASEPSRLGDFEAGFVESRCPKVCIDHHLSERLPIHVAHVIEPQSASTGQLVLGLLDLLGVTLDRPMAEALFVAMATDTGWFRYSNTTPPVLETAARLLGHGLEPDLIYRRIYERVCADRLRLQGRVLAAAQVELDGDLVCSCVDTAMLRESGLSTSDLEGVIDPLRTVEGSEVAALLTEWGPGEWKISLRSRGRVDVESVARRLGGGGHAMAAGARASGTREEVLGMLRNEVETAVHVARKGS
jgi:phosphoesterase RecJ-like protein